jgi:hypothetical protein
LASSSKRLGIATDKPMVSTNLGKAAVVRRLRKISRSRSSPIAGARMNTETRTEGTMPHSHTTRILKNMAAETYAWAPKAKLKTPEVLYVSAKPMATSA